MWQRSWIGVVVLAVAAVPAQGQVKLEWKLKQGDKFYFETVMNQKQVIDAMGMKIPMSMAMTQLMSFEVLKKEADGGMVLRQVIEDVKMKGEGQAAATQEEMAQKMKGAAFTITLDKDGRSTKFEGLDAFWNRIAGDNPAVAKMMKTMMNEDSFKQMFQELFAFVPGKAVAKGDSWKRDMAMALGPMGRFKITQHYTYDGPAADGEQVRVKSDFSFEPGQDTGDLPFRITKGDFKATDTKGLMVFDTKTGRVVRMEHSAKIKGSMTVSVGGMEVSMEMEMDQDAKSRVLDKKP